MRRGPRGITRIGGGHTGFRCTRIGRDAAGAARGGTMRHRARGALVTVVVLSGAGALAGCETHSEAIANPCPNASSSGAPQEPKVGLTADEQKAQDDCSSSNETKDKACAAVDALNASVTDLKNVDVVANGTDALQSAASTVKDDAETLRAGSASALKPAVDRLESSLTTLRSSIENIVSDGLAPARTAAENARQSARDLESQAQTLYKC
jgi:hypothetical protein